MQHSVNRWIIFVDSTMFTILEIKTFGINPFLELKQGPHCACRCAASLSAHTVISVQFIWLLIIRNMFPFKGVVQDGLRDFAAFQGLHARMLSAMINESQPEWTMGSPQITLYDEDKKEEASMRCSLLHGSWDKIFQRCPLMSETSFRIHVTACGFNHTGFKTLLYAS